MPHRTSGAELLLCAAHIVDFSRCNVIDDFSRGSAIASAQSLFVNGRSKFSILTLEVFEKRPYPHREECPDFCVAILVETRVASGQQTLSCHRLPAVFQNPLAFFFSTSGSITQVLLE